METYFIFLVKASCCVSAFYLLGYILFRNDKAFKLQRFYLLAAIHLSLTLPFNRMSINVFKDAKPTVLQTAIPSEIQTISQPHAENNDVKEVSQFMQIPPVANKYSFMDVLTFLYWVVMLFFLARVVYSLRCIITYYIRGQRIKDGKNTIIFLSAVKNSFSFFRWIFISEETKANSDNQNIIKHEIVHADQYHSLDVIAVELLSAVMWFNPFIWLIRKDMQQLHEYLADEGVVLSGTNVLEYQALLVNQVAGDRLISLPSGFSQSLIKKRLAMMTKTSIKSHKWYRLWALMPITGIMFMILSFTNKAGDRKPSNSGFQPLLTQNTNADTTKKKPLLKTTKKFVPSATTKDTAKSKKSLSQSDNASGSEGMPPPPPKPGMIAAVAPTKMNVFYLGVDNPVSIAVSGVSSDKIFPTITNGSIRREGNLYIVNPRQVGLTTINILAKVDGKEINAGTMEFRVKRVPDPVAKVGGKKGGSIAQNFLLAQNTVEVDLENFDFDAKYRVTEFTVSATESGYVRDETSKSDKISDAQKNIIRALKPGDKVFFTDIKAAGPDGTIRALGTIVFKIEE